MKKCFAFLLCVFCLILCSCTVPNGSSPERPETDSNAVAVTDTGVTEEIRQAYAFLFPEEWGLAERAALYQPITNEKAAEAVNQFCGDLGPFTVEKMKRLKSVAFPNGYVYVLCELLPRGYAIMDNEGYLMEANFHGGDLPLALDDGVDYYYVGAGSFATEENGTLYHWDSGKAVTRAGLQHIMTVEVRKELSKQGKEPWTVTPEDFDGIDLPFDPSE